MFPLALAGIGFVNNTLNCFQSCRLYIFVAYML